MRAKSSEFEREDEWDTDGGVGGAKCRAPNGIDPLYIAKPHSLVALAEISSRDIGVHSPK